MSAHGQDELRVYPVERGHVLRHPVSANQKSHFQNAISPFEFLNQISFVHFMCEDKISSLYPFT